MSAVPTRTLFKNATVWSAGSAAPGEVLVEGNTILEVSPPGTISAEQDGLLVVDCGGGTIMPGLIDGHTHLGMVGSPSAWWSLPIEEHTLAVMHNARILLDSGFTGLISGGAVKPRLDIAIRNEINAGRIPGPRMLACTPEMTCTGGLGDDSLLEIDIFNGTLIFDGPDEFRKVVRTYAREGVDLFKIGISGNPYLPNAPAQATLMTREEVDAVTSTARSFNKLVAAHARSNESVEMCLDYGVNLIYHSEFVGEPTIDRLEEARDLVHLAPAFAPVYSNMFMRTWDNPWYQEESERQYEAHVKTYNEVRKRGIKVLIGGEYGLPNAGCEHGNNAKDIEHFVNEFGYSTDQALTAATQWGAEAMRRGDELGRIEPGYLADLLVVDGRPDLDVTLLQHREKLLVIMKDGGFHKLHSKLAPETELATH